MFLIVESAARMPSESSTIMYKSRVQLVEDRAEGVGTTIEAFAVVLVRDVGLAVVVIVGVAVFVVDLSVVVIVAVVDKGALQRSLSQHSMVNPRCTCLFPKVEHTNLESHIIL